MGEDRLTSNERTDMRWTDELVREFVKVATSGSYGDYDDCYTLNAKMKRFKKLKRKEEHESME